MGESTARTRRAHLRRRLSAPELLADLREPKALDIVQVQDSPVLRGQATELGEVGRVHGIGSVRYLRRIPAYGSPLPTHATMLSMLRLIAVAYLGQNGEAVAQRIATLEAINEELDLSE